MQSRRLAAIMFTDMIGYTALAQKNESLALSILEEQRKLVRSVLSRHNGTEVKTIGDAFFIEFSSALDAVKCGYDIQKTVKEYNITLPKEQTIHLRVGIHLGDVVESQGDISGDAVNIASRVEPLAEDGGICLTRQVYDHVRNKFEAPLTSIGVKPLKNVEVPIEVFKIEMPWSMTKQGGVVSPGGMQRIAVLPFENISPSQDDAYISDGLTEEMISTLSRIKGLRVIARTSVLRYKSSKKGIVEIGRELNVGSLLEGSVRKLGEKLRISVQLIDSSTEEHVWAQDYDRSIADVFEVQKEIATKVADELRVKLQPQEKENLQKKGTGNSGAFTVYLKGRYFWNERTKEGLEKALEYFRKAIELDPSYAEAYSGLADTYSLMAFQNYMPSKDAFPKVKSLCEKAIEIDETLAEAHASLGWLYDETGYWKDAEKEYKKAIDLNPSYAIAHFWYGIHLTWLGRHDDAISETKKAEELDLFSPSIMVAVGQALTYARRYDEAIDWLTNVIRNNPGVYNPHFILSLNYLFKGMYTQARDEAGKTVALSKTPPERALMALGLAEAGLGHIEKTKAILDDLEQKGAQMIMRGALFFALGEKEKALFCLESAYENGESGLGWLMVFPYFDQLRGDSRFISLLAKIGSLQ